MGRKGVSGWDRLTGGANCQECVSACRRPSADNRLVRCSLMAGVSVVSFRNEEIFRRQTCSQLLDISRI